MEKSKLRQFLEIEGNPFASNRRLFLQLFVKGTDLQENSASANLFKAFNDRKISDTYLQRLDSAFDLECGDSPEGRQQAWEWKNNARSLLGRPMLAPLTEVAVKEPASEAPSPPPVQDFFKIEGCPVENLLALGTLVVKWSKGHYTEVAETVGMLVAAKANPGSIKENDRAFVYQAIWMCLVDRRDTDQADRWLKAFDESVGIDPTITPVSWHEIEAITNTEVMAEVNLAVAPEAPGFLRYFTEDNLSSLEEIFAVECATYIGEMQDLSGGKYGTPLSAEAIASLELAWYTTLPQRLVKKLGPVETIE